MLLVHVRDHRRVARPGHVVPARGQLSTDVLEVVELPVEDRDDLSRLVRRGLVARLEIDDAQAAVTENAAPERGDAARVGPAVDEGLRHAPDDSRVGRSGGRY